MVVYNVRDKTTREIRITKHGWKHIQQEHPDITLEDIKETLENPIKMTLSIYDENVRWYYQYKKKKRLHILVSVKYLNGDGFVITAFYTKNIQ